MQMPQQRAGPASPQRKRAKRVSIAGIGIKKAAALANEAAAPGAEGGAPAAAHTTIADDRQAAEIGQLLSGCIQNFNELNKMELRRALDRVAVLLVSPDVDKAAMHGIVLQLQTARDTAYYHFFEEDLYALHLAVLQRSAKLSTQTKRAAYDYLLGSSDLEQLFGDIARLYDRIDGFYVRKLLFRNYMLQRIVERAADEYDEGRRGAANKPAAKALGRRFADLLVRLSDWLEHAQGFVEHLVKHHEDLHCRMLLLAYLYRWLRDIKVDLCVLKGPEELQGVEGSVVSRIATVFKGMRKAAIVQSTERSGEENSNRIKLCDDHFLDLLFGNSDIKCVLASVYKRLFFYLLAHNRKTFQSLKILRVFNKAEQTRIYKALRGTRAALVNVFSQLDTRYLIRELVRSADPLIFAGIDPSALRPDDLHSYYTAYFRMAETEQSDCRELVLESKSTGTNETNAASSELEAFARAFNAQVDKAFVQYIKIRSIDGCPLISLAVAEMLAAYAQWHRSVFVDPVYLCSLVLDNPSLATQKKGVPLFNSLLSVLCNIHELLSAPLRARLVPLLCRLLCYDVYIFRAGMLLSRITAVCDQDRMLFGRDAGQALATDPKILAALGHPSFEAVLADCSANPEEKDTAVVYYIHHRPSFAATHIDALLRVLERYRASHTNASDGSNAHGSVCMPSTAQLLLVYLAQLPTGADFPFSFVSDNIRLFHDLAAFSPLVVPIFMHQLRAKAVLPCMVIPHILVSCDPSYVLRLYRDTAVNCVPNALYLVVTRIKQDLCSRSIEEQGVCRDAADSGAENHDNLPSQEKANRLLPREELHSIVESHLKLPFLEHVAKAAGVKRVIASLPPIDDILMAFVIIRQLKGFTKEDMARVLRAIEESTQEESVLELVSNSRLLYSKHSRSTIPVDYIL
ncbi:hypothetical protein PAPHI01_1894 [Pancytospora philotis]|nr:hypothetical protein PAPHI01_1894 [Pancytospora philotis]